MRYVVKVHTPVRRVVANFGLSEDAQAEIFDRMDFELSENPFDILVRISYPQKVLEYVTAANCNGKHMTIGFWMEHFIRDDTHYLLAIEVFNLTLEKRYTGKKLPVTQSLSASPVDSPDR